MSAAEKRVRAHFKHYRSDEGFIRSITTGEGVFPLLADDLKYLAGERRRTCREIERAVEAIDPVEWALAGQDAATIIKDIIAKVAKR